MKRYQLVLQWPAASVDDYESMISIEDSLIERLPDDSEVDGHDGGSGQVNIFILTNSPAKTFQDAKCVLKDFDAFSNIRVAYCDLEGDEYTILWPRNLKEFKLL